MKVEIHDASEPSGKVADVALRFEPGDVARLDGLTISGFAVFRLGAQVYVTFPGFHNVLIVGDDGGWLATDNAYDHEWIRGAILQAFEGRHPPGSPGG
jgi:hypothetical protein